MPHLTINDLIVKHDYYAETQSYETGKTYAVYKTWEEFYKEFKDSEMHYNLVVRWDIYEEEKGGAPQGVYNMNLIILAQRKAIYMGIVIKSVQEKNVLEIVAFLEPRLKYLIELWQPLASQFLTEH